jgi:hypothetical protein
MTYLPRVKIFLTCGNCTHFLFSHMWEFIMVKSKNILKAKKINILALVWFFIRIFSNPIIYLFIYFINALIWNITNFWWLIFFFKMIYLINILIFWPYVNWSGVTNSVKRCEAKVFFLGLSWINVILNVMGDSMEIHSSKYKSHYSRFITFRKYIVQTNISWR